MISAMVRTTSAGFAVMLLSVGPALAGPVATPVPEPASLGLMAVGVGAVAWIKFRRRK